MSLTEYLVKLNKIQFKLLVNKDNNLICRHYNVALYKI